MLLSDRNGGGGSRVADMLSQVRLKSYDREDEFESDKHGLRFPAQVGYEATELIGGMEISAKASGGGGSRSS